MNDAFQSVYERGFAVGHSDIRRDAIVLQYKDEIFDLPTVQAMKVARWNGYFYEAPIEALRKLEAELSSG